MCDYGYEKYKFYIDRKDMISKEGVEWLCKNIFKQNT